LDSSILAYEIIAILLLIFSTTIEVILANSRSKFTIQSHKNLTFQIIMIIVIFTDLV